MVIENINNNNNKIIKTSKKNLSWSKNLENIKIISHDKNYIENQENIDKKNDYQDILKLKIKYLLNEEHNEIDLERKKYIRNKIDFYLLKINKNNLLSTEENILILDI